MFGMHDGTTDKESMRAICDRHGVLKVRCICGKNKGACGAWIKNDKWRGETTTEGRDNVCSTSPFTAVPTCQAGVMQKQLAVLPPYMLVVVTVS